jgi:hypothetical protein
MLARHMVIGQKSLLKLGPIVNADLIAPRAVARKGRRPDLRCRVAGHGALQCSAGEVVRDPDLTGAKMLQSK